MARILFVRLALAGLVSLSGSLPVIVSTGTAASAQAVGPNKSNLPIPRFVSLKSSRVNLRVGPGRGYPVDWMFLKAGLPVEVIQEYDNWRRIRDSEGTEGWVNQSLLSGKRTAVAAPWNKGKDATLELRREPVADSGLVAQVEPGAVGEISRCNGSWCEVSFDGYRGWMSQTLLWGAYPDEQIDK